MNTGSPDSLERFVDRACRGQPALKAPASLAARVSIEIERRAALPRWRRSFAHWPTSLRVALVIACLGAVAVSLTVGGWSGGSVAAAAEMTPLRGAWVWMDGAAGWLLFMYQIFDEVAAALVRSIPPALLYGSLVGIGTLYVLLAGLGATAYRTLYAGRISHS
jgi:hypothetical protein